MDIAWGFEGPTPNWGKLKDVSALGSQASWCRAGAILGG